MDTRSVLRRPSALIIPLLVGLVILGAALALKSGNSRGAHTSALAGHAGAVEIKNFSFMPAKLTVKAATKITFRNGDSTEHHRHGRRERRL